MHSRISNFIPAANIEPLIEETFAFRKKYYTEENLAAHKAYLSDEKPHRNSFAFAMGSDPVFPLINIDDVEFPRLEEAEYRVMKQLGLSPLAHTLFNIQEYYSEAEPVPKHCDGELLDFSVNEDGTLNIRRSIRPQKVAVLTLVNDSVGGGTRLYSGEGETLVTAGPGDLLIFDNIDNFHGVDRLTGTVKRSDGILRMIIGWRSLNEQCFYMENPSHLYPISTITAEELRKQWLTWEWPQQWANIQSNRQKAAF
jgi:hypothetical protein